MHGAVRRQQSPLHPRSIDAQRVARVEGLCGLLAVGTRHTLRQLARDVAVRMHDGEDGRRVVDDDRTVVGKRGVHLAVRLDEEPLQGGQLPLIE